MANADTFLKIFNTLEDWLKTEYSKDRHIPFYQLLEIASSKNRAVSHHQNFLKHMGNLRNVILHDKDFPSKILADPRSDIVAEFSNISEKIMEPMTILSKAVKDFEIFTPKTELSEVLPLMRDNDFSQVMTILDDGSISLVTREGVAMWVEANIEDDLISIRDATLQDILPYEDDASWICIARDTNIYEGIQSLSNPSHRIQALIITESGSPKQKPIGLFTIWDMKEILPHV